MPIDASTSLSQLTLRQLLDAYADARLARRDDEMKRLDAEIAIRQARGEQA